MDFHWSKGLGTQDCSLVLCISNECQCSCDFIEMVRLLFDHLKSCWRTWSSGLVCINSSVAFITSEQTKYWHIVTFIFTQTGDNLIYNAEMNAEQKHRQMFVADCISMWWCCVCASACTVTWHMQLLSHVLFSNKLRSRNWTHRFIGLRQITEQTHVHECTHSRFVSINSAVQFCTLLVCFVCSFFF